MLPSATAQSLSSSSARSGRESVPGATAQTAMLVEARGRAETASAGAAKTPKRIDEAGPRRFLVAGRSPAHLVEELFETTRAPEEVLDWRAALLLFVARARSPVHTWSRPSRRFPSRIFEVPGRTWAPRRTENPRLLVAIDTSLSMTKRELEEIARQLVVLGEPRARDNR